MVRLSWDDPSQSGGSVIDKYDVEIKKKDGTTWLAPEGYCFNSYTDTDGNEVASDIKEANDAAENPIHLCRISMEQMETLFELEFNDSIVARVRAVNAAGLEGEWRESDDSAKVKTKPQ
jgi:hypothetical protein